MKSYTKKFIRKVLPAVLALFLFTGCGEADEQDSRDGQNGESSFRVERCVPIQWEEQGIEGQEASVCTAAYGDKFYLLVSLGGAEADSWLYTFNMDTGKTDKTPFALETPGMEKPVVESMTVTGEGELTLRLFGTLEGSDGNRFLCRTDLTGKPLDEKTPIREDGEFPPVSGRIWTSPEGFALETKSGDSNENNIFRYDLSDPSPEKVTSVDGFVNALCSDGQEGLYYIENNYLWRLAAGDEAAESVISMAELGIEIAWDNHLLTDGKGRLAVCCVSGEGAEVWLLTDGEQVPAEGPETGFEQPESSAQSENSELSEATEQTESSVQPEAVEKETIRIANLKYGSEIVDAARYWAAKSGRYKILTEPQAKNREEQEALRTRALADLAAGNGPEFLVVSEDDMRMLAEKGAILDLSELVPEDIQEQILPGVRELGTVNGVWVGLGWHPTINVMFTSDALWSGDSWTVSDILDLAEEREPEWIYGFRDLTSEDANSYHMDGNDLMSYLVLSILGDSPFLDLENGMCSFDGEEFIRVLEFCKRYGRESSFGDNGEEMDAMLQDGCLLAMNSYFYSGFYSYSNLAVRLPGCHPVGYPAEKGSGSYISSDNYLVVNADASNLEAIKDCIAYLYSYDCQTDISTVRMDVADDQIVYDPKLDQEVLKIKGFTMVPDKSPDGTSYKEEYLELLESLEPKPYCPQAIRDIVEEESSQYFGGDRSAQETAETIQRRVQLYLDEQ